MLVTSCWHHQVKGKRIHVIHSTLPTKNLLKKQISPCRSFWRFRQKEYLNTKAQLWPFLINKLVTVTPLTNNILKKAEIFSFPTIPGSGGCGQSLHNKVLVGAKGLRLCFLSILRCASKRSPLQKWGRRPKFLRTATINHPPNTLKKHPQHGFCHRW